MRKVNVIAGLVLFFCTFIFAFDNYKQAYDSGMKKTEGFGEYDGAREDFNKAIALTNKATEKADAMFQIGETYYWQGNYNQAREEYSKIIKMDKLPSSYEAQSQLRIGDAFAAEKNYSQARQEYAKALGMQGKVANTGNRRFASLPKVEAQYKIGEMYRAEGNYQKAKEEFSRILLMEEASEKDKLEVKYRIKSIYR